MNEKSKHFLTRSTTTLSQKALHAIAHSVRQAQWRCGGSGGAHLNVAANNSATMRPQPAGLDVDMLDDEKTWCSRLGAPNTKRRKITATR